MKMRIALLVAFLACALAPTAACSSCAGPVATGEGEGEGEGAEGEGEGAEGEGEGAEGEGEGAEGEGEGGEGEGEGEGAEGEGEGEGAEGEGEGAEGEGEGEGAGEGEGEGEGACPTPTDTLFVDGIQGSDATGNGSSACPLRSITQALTDANASALIGTVHVVGGTSAAVTYSVAATGEVFPLSPRHSLHIEGDGAAAVTIDGSGGAQACPNNVACTFDVAQDAVTISDLTVTAVGGTRGIVVENAGSFALTNANVSNCPGAGVIIGGVAVASLTGVNLTANGTGLVALGSSSVSLDTVAMTQNGGALSATDTAQVSSSGCSFDANSGNDAQGAVQLSSAAVWSSSGDEIKNNARDGVLAATAGAGVSVNTITITNDVITGNGTANTGHGVRLDGSSLLTMRGTTVLANTGNGIFVNNTSRADLGNGNGNPGGNVLQAATGGNTLAGVCNNTAITVNADGDHWSQCPQTTSTNCANGVDIGTSGGGAVTGNSCASP